MENELLVELKSAWEDFKDADAKRVEEVKRLGHETAETKDQIERISKAMTDLEVRIAAIDTTSKRDDGKSPEVKAFEGWLRAEHKAPGDPPAEPAALVFSEEDAQAVLAPPELVTEMLEIAYVAEPLLDLVTTRRITRASVMYPVKEARAAAMRDGAAPDFTVRSTVSGPFGRGEIKVFGAHAVADIEAVSLEDPSVDLAADLMGDFAWSFGQLEGPEILTGDVLIGAGGMLRAGGPGNPAPPLEHIYTGAAPQGGEVGLTYLAFAEAVDALKVPYRPGAVWVLNRKSISKVRTITDPHGEYVWQPGLDLGNPGAILGFPYRLSENVAEVADGNHAVLFGDFKRGYWLVQRIDMQVQRDPYTQWPNVRFKARKRSGGDVVMPEAIKVITIGESPSS